MPPRRRGGKGRGASDGDAAASNGAGTAPDTETLGAHAGQWTKPRITAVGLGPAGPEMLAIATRTVLATADSAFLRTRRHPAAVHLPGVQSFDHYYEKASTFEEVYRLIVEDLVKAAEDSYRNGRGGHVVYGVPGSPLVAERTVDMLREDERINLTVVPSLSFLDLAWDRLRVDPMEAGVRVVDGTQFSVATAGERGPFLVAQCWSRMVLSQIKLSVTTHALGYEPTATILHHLGLEDERVETVRWDDLDRVLEPDHLTSVWVPMLSRPIGQELLELDELVHRLRRDCPWDREQTHASLTRHLIEEAYEVVEAIDLLEPPATVQGEGGDQAQVAAVGDEAERVAHLQEELGDLLFQVYFHACLAAEEGRFTLADVARGIHDKLVARHPHVFAGVEAPDPDTVMHNWEALKMAEKGRDSVVEGIPMSLPALSLAAKLQRKADDVAGLNLPDFDQERRWVEAALAQLPLPAAGAEAGASDDMVRQVGALLWSVADLGRQLGIDPEDALRAAARRFSEHVREVEIRAAAQNGSTGTAPEDAASQAATPGVAPAG